MQEYYLELFYELLKQGCLDLAKLQIPINCVEMCSTEEVCYVNEFLEGSKHANYFATGRTIGAPLGSSFDAPAQWLATMLCRSATAAPLS